MGKTIPVEIGARHFASQKDATFYFKAMLSRYSIGQRVSDEDAVDLQWLIQRHINHNEKIGVGIDHFVVMDDGYGWKCFGVVRSDGTMEDFTYRRCITQRWDG